MANLKFYLFSLILHGFALAGVFLIQPQNLNVSQEYLVALQAQKSNAAAKGDVQIQEINKQADSTPTTGESFATNQQSDAAHSLSANKLPDWIQAQIHYPIRSRQKGEQGAVKIFLKINEKADILEIRLVQSSGFIALDQAAILALQNATYRKGETRSETVEIEFRLDP